MDSASGVIMESSIGDVQTDSSGSLVAVVRMDAVSAYVGILPLLQSFINESGTEAIMEGKYGEEYGGWGFYFVRLYLSATHDSSHSNDPMKILTALFLGSAGNRGKKTRWF